MQSPGASVIHSKRLPGSINGRQEENDESGNNTAEQKIKFNQLLMELKSKTVEKDISEIALVCA